MPTTYLPQNVLFCGVPSCRKSLATQSASTPLPCGLKRRRSSIASPKLGHGVGYQHHVRVLYTFFRIFADPILSLHVLLGRQGCLMRGADEKWLLKDAWKTSRNLCNTCVRNFKERSVSCPYYDNLKTLTGTSNRSPKWVPLSCPPSDYDTIYCRR